MFSGFSGSGFVIPFIAYLPPMENNGTNRDDVKSFTSGLGQEAIEGKLWIIQKGKIRIYQPE
jgi:hypothetical protein